MKVVILAGGLGSRLSEYTKKIPKPMVKIGNKPIIEHIMNYYSMFGYNEFILAIGYKKNIIQEYFKKPKFSKWKIHSIDTGLNSLTGTRIKKLKKFFKKDEDFFLTYGDGLSNVNLKKLYQFHKSQKKLFTLTAVRPPARFGELFINGNIVKSFEEKPQVTKSWINGGFFIINSKFLSFLPQKNHMLEREPLTRLVKLKQVTAYKHNGFWQCMDTLRDKEMLHKIYKSGDAEWLKKNKL